MRTVILTHTFFMAVLSHWAADSFQLPSSGACRRPARRHTTPHSAAAPVDSDADQSLQSTIDSDKQALLRAIGSRGSDRKELILLAAAALERHSHTVAPVSGRWALVFSTMSDGAAGGEQPLDGVLGFLDTAVRLGSPSICLVSNRPHKSDALTLLNKIPTLLVVPKSEQQLI